MALAATMAQVLDLPFEPVPRAHGDVVAGSPAPEANESPAANQETVGTGLLVEAPVATGHATVATPRQPRSAAEAPMPRMTHGLWRLICQSLRQPFDALVVGRKSCAPKSTLVAVVGSVQ